MTIAKRFTTVAALGMALLSTPTLAQEQKIAIKFAAEFGGKPFSCAEKVSGIGTTKSTITPADFRLYVSEVALVRADGTAVPVTLEQDGKWQHKNVALLDFENAQAGCSNGTPDMRDIVVGTVPAGAYKGLKLTIGVPFDLNHNDPTLAPSPLNLTSMFWTWQAGYKFIKVDMATSGQPIAANAGAGGSHTPPAAGHKQAPAAAGFSIHLGSTMCQAPSRTTAPSTCANSNRMVLSFDTFDPTKNVVVFDPASALAETNVDVNTPETSPGCMSFPNDPDCNTLMPKLGLAYGGKPAEAQIFARMR